MAATLTQRKPGEQCWRVVQYASRSLTDPEKRYSQIELEALARDFGCKKFHLFLYGRHFKMVTDHKPLESVFNKPTHTSSIRVQRIVNRMLDYGLVVEYRPGKENISDYTSRHPMPNSKCSKFELRTTKAVHHYVNYVVVSRTPEADRCARKTRTQNGGDRARGPSGSGANETALESTCMVPGNGFAV